MKESESTIGKVIDPAELPPIARWIDRHIGFAIGIAATVGMVAASAFLQLLGSSCAESHPAGWWATFVCREGGRSLWTAVSGVAAAPALLLTWYWKTAHRRQDLQIARGNYVLAIRANANERFAKAVELLSSEQVSARLGALYALEQLGADAADLYYATVVETISAYVRDRCPRLTGRTEEERTRPESTHRPSRRVPRDLRGPYERADRPTTDIQAALSILGRIKPPSGLEPVAADLSETELPNVQLAYAQLPNASFYRANLNGARLYGANLQGAKFFGCDLGRCYLRSANLSEAFLSGSSLDHVDLLDADLSGARLRAVDLTTAEFLTQRQLDGACGDDDTVLPEGLSVKTCIENEV